MRWLRGWESWESGREGDCAGCTTPQQFHNFSSKCTSHNFSPQATTSAENTARCTTSTENVLQWITSCTICTQLKWDELHSLNWNTDKTNGAKAWCSAPHITALGLFSLLHLRWRIVFCYCCILQSSTSSQVFIWFCRKIHKQTAKRPIWRKESTQVWLAHLNRQIDRKTRTHTHTRTNTHTHTHIILVGDVMHKYSWEICGVQGGHGQQAVAGRGDST